MRMVPKRLRATLEWMLATTLPEESWRVVARSFEQRWPRMNDAARRDWHALCDAHEHAEADGIVALDYLRELHQPGFVGALRKDGAESSRHLLAAYDAAHPVLAWGDPPLTQEVADSYLGILSFVDALTRCRAWAPVDAATRATFSAQMAQQYPSLTPAQQQWLAGLPLEWARTRYLWRAGGDGDRVRDRERLIGLYGATAQVTPVLAQATPSLPPMPVIGSSTQERSYLEDEVRAVAEDVPVQGTRSPAVAGAVADGEQAGSTDPALALQEKLQAQVANAAFLSNVMKMQHQIAMSFAQSIGRI